ncbi:MAG: alkaline phytoceramidase [Alphaproteobacteria bacterium]|nr:alkaline phytoceramidase [Alphaproteobacteria bacterium]
MTFTHRILILGIMFSATLAALGFVPPIPQDPNYHNLADPRPYLGIPNFGDVTSNAGFLIVGVLGLMTVLGRKGREIFTNRTDALPYIVFFAGVGLVSIGSSYYHLVPDNDRLFWDRLPMTIAFTALFSAIVADRIDRTTGIKWLLPILIALGIASLLYWDWTESQGRGDLRFYGLVQFYPMIALPVICWLFPKARYTGGGYLIWVIFWYAAAKVLEYFDAEILALLGGAVSGHSLKHLAAAMATLAVLRMVAGSRRPAV